MSLLFTFIGVEDLSYLLGSVVSTVPGFRVCKTCVVICIIANLADSISYSHLRGVSLKQLHVAAGKI